MATWGTCVLFLQIKGVLLAVFDWNQGAQPRTRRVEPSRRLRSCAPRPAPPPKPAAPRRASAPTPPTGAHAPVRAARSRETHVGTDWDVTEIRSRAEQLR